MQNDIYVKQGFSMIENPKVKDLYRLQEDVLGRLQVMGDAQFAQAKLCGGTAMSRCWLGHRVSVDLDFFLPEGFDAGRMATKLKTANVAYERPKTLPSCRMRSINRLVPKFSINLYQRLTQNQDHAKLFPR